MDQKIGLTLILGMVMLVMGGVVAHDFISNNRMAQIMGNQNDKDWNSVRGWGTKDKTPEPSQPQKEQITANNYQKAIELSGHLGKPVLIYFEADWCTWCKKMKQDTLTDAKVKEAMKNYIVVFVDTDKNREVADKFNVKYLPAYSITNVREANLKSGGKYKDARAMTEWLNNPQLYKQPKEKVAPPVEPPSVNPPNKPNRPWRPNPPSNPPGGG